MAHLTLFTAFPQGLETQSSESEWPGILHCGASDTALMLYSPCSGQTGNFLSLKLSNKSSFVGVSVSVFFFSRAHSCLAASICLRLLMHAFFCDVCLALTQFGTAIPASIPIGTIADTSATLPGC